jgi:hypothetical protein
MVLKLWLQVLKPCHCLTFFFGLRRGMRVLQNHEEAIIISAAITQGMKTRLYPKNA